MKVIKYRICTEVNHGTEEDPQIEQVFSDAAMVWNEESEEIAGREAYEGIYSIENDGNPAAAPTEQEKLRADVDYIAIMTGVEL